VSRNIFSLCPGTFSPCVQEHFLLMSRNISSLCLRNIFLWEKYFHKGRKNMSPQREKKCTSAKRKKCILTYYSNRSHFREFIRYKVFE
jgi:hypothetical protein